MVSVQELENDLGISWIYDDKGLLRQLIFDRMHSMFAQGDMARDAIKSTEELEARRKYISEKLIEAIGGLPLNAASLNPKITGTIECDGFRIEKVIYESRPKTYVTANLYIPNDVAGPRGAVLFLCGHHTQGKHVDEYQIVCRYLVRAGLVVLSQDPIGHGERFSYYEDSIKDTTVIPGSREHDYAGNQCWPLGDSLARYFVHDAMRGVDYLRTRPEVDPDKIGVTGNSGGGTQTCLMMLCDPRIAAAAPGTFLASQKGIAKAALLADAEQIWPGMTALGFEHEDILISMASRPVLVLAATSDYFPIEATRRSVDRTRRFWEMYGKEDCLELFEDDCTHMYSRVMAKKAAEFFSLHLPGSQSPPANGSIEPIEPSMLWCTKSGQINGEIEGARIVYDENCTRLKNIEKQRDNIFDPERRKKALAWLKGQVFCQRLQCELNPRHYITFQINDLLVQKSFWWTQKELPNCGLTFRDYRFAGKRLPVTIADWDGGAGRLQPHMKWIREICSAGRAVMVLDVSGVGNIMPGPLIRDNPSAYYMEIFKLAHDLMWLGDSMAAMRTYDVIRALDAIELFKGIDADDIRLYAHGAQGIYAGLAAVLDKRVKSITAEEGVESIADFTGSLHYDQYCYQYDAMGIILPGMLKYFDLPDLDGWIG
ncbi:MAG: hypothetical protein FIA99_13995 [Ruminiclostridium sp.]|nr:hypothetical protein [Ruminiclostridium sp.]